MLDKDIKYLQKLVDVAHRVSIETGDGSVATRVQQEVSSLFMLVLLNSYSMVQLLHPKQNLIPSMRSGSVFYDFTTITIISRSIFEAFVNMHTLAVNPMAEAERDVLLDLWDLHSLCERQVMARILGNTAPIIEKEKIQIADLIQRIKNIGQVGSGIHGKYDDILKRLANWEKAQPNTKEWYVSPRWTCQSAEKRAKYADVHEYHSHFLYKYSSNYLHANGFAAKQIHGIEGYLDGNRLCGFGVKFATMFLAGSIEVMAQISDKANKVIDSMPEIIELLEFWKKVRMHEPSDLI
ncbi:MAG TPA: DUF5677 domain-containing protein, partial [Patescibacteria group bacterium]|nr:DUF5677 domain-containing protein [Patescibacteria group bacterium]